MAKLPSYGRGHRVKSLGEQVNILRRDFGRFDLRFGFPNADDRVGIMEGRFVVPKWNVFGETYGEAYQALLAHGLGLNQSFCDYRDGKVGLGYVQLCQRTDRALRKLYAEQSSDLVFFPAQLGAQYSSKSIAVVEGSMHETEFALGPFEVACILRTHPELLADYDDLWIMCAGALARRYRSDSFNQVPSFHAVPGELGIAHDFISRATCSPKYGCVTGCT